MEETILAHDVALTVGRRQCLALELDVGRYPAGKTQTEKPQG